MDFSGQVAFVTGGSAGIGAAIVRRFAEAGAQVVFCGTDAAKGAASEAELRAAGLEARFVRADVSAEGEVAAAIEATLAMFGRLDHAVNSAGIYQFDTPPITELDVDYWNRILAVDLTGTFLCMKHEIAAMLRTGGGSVVNIASGAALKPVPQTYAYVAAKHGLVGLSKTAALDYAKRNVRVNLLCPGLVQTPMTSFLDTLDEAGRDALLKANAMERIGQPDEIADAALWLCGPGASFTTGVVLPIDGGFSIR